MKEIEQEASGHHGMAMQEKPKQTADTGLSERLKDSRARNAVSSQKGFLYATLFVLFHFLQAASYILDQGVNISMCLHYYNLFIVASNLSLKIC